MGRWGTGRGWGREDNCGVGERDRKGMLGGVEEGRGLARGGGGRVTRLAGGGFLVGTVGRAKISLGEGGSR